MSLPANRNLLWARVFLAEWIGQGLQAACVASGSRSTPLAMALAEFADQGALRLYVHNDERSAAYFALGLARASGQPVAVVCTSGTAAANFYPAVIEADASEVPLLLLTADRPPELRGSGANQTIDQVKLFGDAVRTYAEVPLPEADPTPSTLRALRGLAARTWLTALAPLPGPVQVNFPFRKPLEPIPVSGDVPDWLGDDHALLRPQAQTYFALQARSEPALMDVEWLLERLEAAARPAIVCGPRSAMDVAFAPSVLRLAEQFGAPIFADALSGVRFGREHPLLFGAYDAWIARLPRPDFVLRFGDLPTSTALMDWLDEDGIEHVYVGRYPRWRDDRFRTTRFILADPSALLSVLNAAASGSALHATAWSESAGRYAQAFDQALGAARTHPDCEACIFPILFDFLPSGDALMVSNSLPVRHLDQFVPPRAKEVRVFANRGASGIDGVLSTGLGLAAHFGHVTMVLGDLAFYHDMNGLLALRRYGLKATILVIQNDGGGIFYRLPVAHFEPPFRELFVTPHGLRFEPVAALYGLEYHFVEELRDLPKVLGDLDWGGASLIEVRSDAQAFESWRRKFFASI
ncbi:MAG: 2-succinyl-5-enolpyruvyl-6-hydroxy-3-cyclohexene-1-carboxylic-acid synthase [Anaerolineales bacterium]